MTRQFPDIENAGRLLLTELLAEHGRPDITVAVGVPERWANGNHVAVALDGITNEQTGWGSSLISGTATLRFVARGNSTREAQETARLCQGLLVGSSDGTVRIRPGVGVQPARDPQTKAELAGFTVLVTVRSEPILAGS